MTDQDAQALRLPESTRVEAFSDGVFAIALTLLVLDLHAPSGARGQFVQVLVRQWPAYVAYLAAFLNIAAIWINHHDLFSRVRRVDARLICANLLLLLVSSLFPWPASVISAAARTGDRGDQIAAMVLYAAVGFLVPLAWDVLYFTVARSPHLLSDPAGAAFARLRMDVKGEGVAAADVVIEAIFENIEAKQALYAELEPKLKPNAILATNTSSIKIETLCEKLRDPSRLVGIHFFNPVAQLQLVEIVHGASTQPEVAQNALRFTRKLDKLPLP